MLFVYTLILLARLVFEYIPIFNPQWRPRGATVVLAEVVYTVTDPPVKFFRRFVPPLRAGGMSIDFGFALTMLLVFLLMSIARSLI